VCVFSILAFRYFQRLCYC